jgi:hypothetical protein
MQEQPNPRLLFHSKDRQEIVQIQDDRLMHNWRAQSDDAEYPRYHKKLRPCFERQLESFVSFLGQEKLDTPVFDQIEVTYVSMMPSGSRRLLQ